MSARVVCSCLRLLTLYQTFLAQIYFIAAIVFCAVKREMRFPTKANQRSEEREESEVSGPTFF